MANATTATKTTSRTATHQGTCQICGRQQMLPKGKLAKHGYTTRWGFFSGTCTGSDRMPFETHTDAIADAIERAKAHAAHLRTLAAALLASTDETTVWVHVYYAATWSDRSSRYVWEQLPVQRDERGAFVIETGRDTNGGARTRRTDVKDYNLTLLQSVQAMNARRAAEWLTEAKKYDGYVVWQTERVANWKPGKLVPVAAKANGGGPLVHFGLSYWGRGKACSSSYMASQTGHTTTDMSKVTCAKCKQGSSWATAVETAAANGGTYTLRYKSGDTVKVVA